MTEERPEDFPKLENYTPSGFMLPTSHAHAARDLGFCDRVMYTEADDKSTDNKIVFDKAAMVTNTIAAMRKKLKPIPPKQEGVDISQFEKRLELLK